jgi:hypothetical protein
MKSIQMGTAIVFWFRLAVGRTPPSIRLIIFIHMILRRIYPSRHYEFSGNLVIFLLSSVMAEKNLNMLTMGGGLSRAISFMISRTIDFITPKGFLSRETLLALR